MTYYRDGSPIAVIGFSFRMPGGTDKALWQALLAGHELVTSVESNRWPQDASCIRTSSSPGRVLIRSQRVQLVTLRDSMRCFSGFPPREAEQMSPQQPFHVGRSLVNLEAARWSGGMPGSNVRSRPEIRNSRVGRCLAAIPLANWQAPPHQLGRLVARISPYYGRDQWTGFEA